MLFWLDIETNGLDEREVDSYLLEVAFVLTDDNLNERAANSWIIHPGIPIDQLKMPFKVREMHENSRLLSDLESGNAVAASLGLLPMQQAIVKWFLSLGRLEDLGDVPLCGSSVSFDRRWVRHHMPKIDIDGRVTPSIDALFSHQSIDVSTLTALARRWNRPVYAGRPKQDKHVPHRALDDARNSIEYLRYYRSRFLREDLLAVAESFKKGGQWETMLTGDASDKKEAP